MSRAVVLLTGGNGGIGKAAAIILARQGARLLLVCRDRGRGLAALADIRSESGSDAVDLLCADLSSQASIRSLAREVRQRTSRLDVLINNAGVLQRERRLTCDGLEATFATNHLGSFLLTVLLLDLLRATPGSRVVNVASESHRRRWVRAALRFDNLQGERGYSGVAAYGQSKLANILFTYELARRLQGQAPTVNCVHPGFSATGLVHRDAVWVRAAWWVARPLMRSAWSAAESVALLATAPQFAQVSGRYFNRLSETRSSPLTYDPLVAGQLWSISKDLTRLGEGDAGQSWPLVS